MTKFVIVSNIPSGGICGNAAVEEGGRKEEGTRRKERRGRNEEGRNSEKIQRPSLSLEM